MKKSITQIKCTFVILNKYNNKKTYILHIKKGKHISACLCVAYALYVKSEQNDIAVLHNVILTLKTNKTLFLSRRHRATAHKIVK